MYTVLHQVKELPNDSGRPLGYKAKKKKKKKKKPKLATDWKTWPKCDFLFLFLFLFFPSSRHTKFGSVTTFQYEMWSLIYGWTRYKTEHRVEEVCCTKYFIVSVISFHVYFDEQFIKIWEKIKQAKNKQTNTKTNKQQQQQLEFCWIKRAPKNKPAAALRHTI